MAWDEPGGDVLKDIVCLKGPSANRLDARARDMGRICVAAIRCLYRGLGFIGLTNKLDGEIPAVGQQVH